MSNNTDILAPFLPKIMDGLLTMATQSTDDVLALVLESLRIVMSVRWLQHQPSSQTFSLRSCEGWVGKAVEEMRRSGTMAVQNVAQVHSFTISVPSNLLPPIFPRPFFSFSFLFSRQLSTAWTFWHLYKPSFDQTYPSVCICFTCRSIKNLQRLVKEEYHP